MQIFFTALKIGILMESFNPNLKKYELKIHRGITCHDNEELRKICRRTDLSFQSWYKEFEGFWTEHLKVSKMFILMGSFWEKYILLELKRYRGVIFHENEGGSKIWRGIDSSFQNWHKEHSKVSKIFTLICSFWANIWTEKVGSSLRVMQNLKINWLVTWKMAWRIWQIFTRALESV